MNITAIPNNNLVFNKYNNQKTMCGRKTSSTIDLYENNNVIDANGYYNKISFCGRKEYKKHKIENYTGCLIGGAIGDALGCPVEFMKIDEILEKYGDDGICKLPLNKERVSPITDDTQMTMFTADGLIKSQIKKNDSNLKYQPDYQVVFDSYKDWRETQFGNDVNKGWISEISALKKSRGPGATCLRSLFNNKKGSIDNKINNINGNGGTMRVAPVGLMYYKNPELAFRVGAQCAALTHGNPSAYLSAGYLSGLIAYIIQGYSIENAAKKTLKILEHYDSKDAEPLKEKINKAIEFSQNGIDSQWAIREMGNSSTGDGAIGVALYCALKNANNFEKGVIMAVNHSGDSDTTGAITGNILGAYLGEDSIPLLLTRKVELNDELDELAGDIYYGLDELYDKETRYPIK